MPWPDSSFPIPCGALCPRQTKFYFSSLNSPHILAHFVRLAWNTFPCFPFTHLKPCLSIRPWLWLFFPLSSLFPPANTYLLDTVPAGTVVGVSDMGPSLMEFLWETLPSCSCLGGSPLCFLSSLSWSYYSLVTLPSRTLVLSPSLDHGLHGSRTVCLCGC